MAQEALVVLTHRKWYFYVLIVNIVIADMTAADKSIGSPDGHICWLIGWRKLNSIEEMSTCFMSSFVEIC